MTKRNDISDETLSKLYEKRKSNHLAPASIKRKLVTKQAKDKSTTAIFNRISYVAVAASTLLLIGIMLLRQEQFNAPPLTYQIIQIHTLDTTKDLSSEGIRNRYAQHYNEYIKR